MKRHPLKAVSTVLLLTIGLASIQGCANLAAAGAAMGSVASDDLRPTKVMMDDKVIAMTITDKIYSSRELQPRVHINPYSYNYVVLLTGEALTQELRDKAVEIARNIKSVRQVYNEVQISDLTTFDSRAKDSWITSKIKGNMVGTKNFDASQVEVITENRTVYLMGFVTETQGTRAAEIARNVEGVKQVIKLFEYVEPGQTAPGQAPVQTSNPQRAS